MKEKVKIEEKTGITNKRLIDLNLNLKKSLEETNICSFLPVANLT